jgi:hypothetical protein
MRVILMLSAVFFLAGCVTTMPQTREEFIKFSSDHPSWYIADKYVSNRPFEAVVNSLHKKWQECYAVSRTTTRSSGGMITSRDTETYHPKIKRINNSSVEMTLQMTSPNMLNKVPPGGYYMVAINIKRLPSGRAEVAWFSNTFWKKDWTRNKDWIDGKNLSCN